MAPDPVTAVRDFNRFYTRVIGVLTDGLLHTPYSLTEARVIFELAQRDRTEVTALRRDLGLDAGYLSRMLARFEADGLVVRDTAEGDARRRVVRLTGPGRAVYADLDRRSAAEVAALLDPVPTADRDRLLAAMGTVRTVLSGGAPPEMGSPAITLREPGPGDLGWVVARHGALYAAEYGWGAGFEALVARIVADFVDHRDPARERGWIALRGGQPVGSVFCVKADETTAKLRLLLVEPAARGAGLGRRLVGECVAYARAAGYTAMTLWTNEVLTAARRIYAAAGFERVDRDGTEETWRRAL
jgi:DNA-binding MarR family transcriptional regulator/GNAT superfamily N-acetyltransferase